MGFPRQEYWNGSLFPFPGDLPDPGIKTVPVASLALTGGFFATSATWDAATWELSNSSWEAHCSPRCNNYRNEDNLWQNIIVMEGDQVSLESVEELGKSRGCLIIWSTGLSETYWVGGSRIRIHKSNRYTASPKVISFGIQLSHQEFP